jgi:hypothetical protein
MKKSSLPAARKPIRLLQASRRSAIGVLLILQSLATFSQADVTDQQLKQWL